MFMAILNDTYSEVKEEVENRKEDFQVGSFTFSDCLRTCIGFDVIRK